MNTQAFEPIHKNYKCYLVGAMERPGSGSDFGSYWRTEVSSQLSKRGIFIFDPTKMEQQKTGMSTKDINERIGSWITCGHKDKFIHAMELIWKGKTIQVEDSVNHTPQVYHLLGDRDYVTESDFLIFYYSKGDSLGGTIIELAIAFYIAHIPIYLVTKEPISSLNKSILYHILMSGQREGDFEHANPTFNNFTALMEYLDITYKLKVTESKE